MLYLLDTVHAQDWRLQWCLSETQVVHQQGHLGKTGTYIYIYIMYEADHSRVPARAAYRLPLSFGSR